MALAVPVSAWPITVLAAFAALVGSASGRLLADAEQPEGGRPSQPTQDPALGGDEPPPAPTVVVVHRQPGGGAPEPARRGKRRRGFGDDPLEEKSAPRALRRAIDDLLGDIEGKRDERNDGDRS